MSARRYLPFTGVSKAAANRALQDLTEKRVLVPTGGDRSICYQINL